ncbi:hypothetical protein FRC08_001498 [Ceratobasidium sp. 394]|nr:hypothetical protein FRC08_001498 [Ceratobasidium sp. 394]
MQVFQGVRLRLIAWFLRANVRIVWFFRRILGTPPYFTKFPPNRSFDIRSSTSRRNIKINVFQPDGFDARKRYPTYINLHGSAFTIPALGTDADFCRFVSNQTGALVLDCDYAKAPEWPFPAAPDDVKDIITHVVKNQGGYFDTSRLAIGGFSAGGNLALTSGASQPPGTLKAAIAFYPVADLYQGTKRPQPKDARNPLPPFMIQFFSDAYMPLGTDMLDPRLSPINTPISCFPDRVFIATCGLDPLQHEGIALADRLEQGGVKVVRRHMPGVLHGWDKEAQGGTPDGEAKHGSYVAAVEMLKVVFKNE